MYSVDSKAICYNHFASQKSLGFGSTQLWCLWKCWGGAFLPWGFPVSDQINSRKVLMLLRGKWKAKRGIVWFWGSKWVFRWGAPLSSTVSCLIIKKHPRSLLSSIQAGFYLLQGWAPFFGAVVNLRNIKMFLTTYLFSWNICLHWEKPYGQLWMLKCYFFSLHQGFFFFLFLEATEIFPSYVTNMHCSDLL